MKKRQCERSHRSKERGECATRAPAAEGESLEGNKNNSTTQPKEGALGRTSAVFEGAPQSTNAQTPNDQERCEGERQCGEYTDRRSVVRGVIARGPGLREAALDSGHR